MLHYTDTKPCQIFTAFCFCTKTQSNMRKKILTRHCFWERAPLFPLQSLSPVALTATVYAQQYAQMQERWRMNTCIRLCYAVQRPNENTAAEALTLSLLWRIKTTLTIFSSIRALSLQSYKSRVSLLFGNDFAAFWIVLAKCVKPLCYYTGGKRENLSECTVVVVKATALL